MCVKKWLAFVISVFCMTLSAGAQQSSPQDLDGTWEIKAINEIADWGGAPEHGLFSVTLSFEYIDGVVDPTEPNLFVDVPDSDDDFIGFARDDMFVLFKENIDNCGGPAVNFGREVIIGEMNKKGTRFKAQGIGFDSNQECGGPWSYHLLAKKISD